MVLAGKTKRLNKVIGAMALLGTILFGAGEGWAHCDTEAGPVVIEARQALTNGDVTPLLKWVPQADEQAVRAAFARTQAVRKLGGEAAELADYFFLETLIRIHRAGEGAPYTGLKSGSEVDPAVALADKSLAEGSVDKLVDILATAVASGLRTRFQETLAAKRHAGENVEAGRQFVNAYVDFSHYVEGLHTLVQGGPGHHAGPAAAKSERPACNHASPAHH